MRGQGLTFVFATTSTHPGEFTYQIDWENDGVFEQTITGGVSLAVNHVFTAAGTRTVAARVIDSSSLASGVQTHGIAIAVYELQADPFHPGQQVLVVGGSTATDVIQIKLKNNTGLIDVKVIETELNLQHRFVAPATVPRIIVYAQAGDDTVTVDKDLSVSAWLHGGLGDDILKGGMALTCFSVKMGMICYLGMKAATC